MKIIQNLSLILILFQIIPITGAINCTCHYLHPQARYCLSETVLYGLYVTTIDHNTFKFFVQDVLKADQPIKEQEVIYVHTPTGCSVPYYPLAGIFLFGNFDDRGLSSKVCAKDQAYEKLTNIQIQGLFYKYKKGCSCLVNVHGDERFKNACLGQNAYLALLDGRICYWEHSLMKNNCGLGDDSWKVYIPYQTAGPTLTPSPGKSG